MESNEADKSQDFQEDQKIKCFKGEIHGHFNMIILKLTDVFEIHVHFIMIILKREQIFLNYRFN